MKISSQLFAIILFFHTAWVYAISPSENIDNVSSDSQFLTQLPDSEPIGLKEQLDNYLRTQQQLLAEKGFRSEYSIGNIDPRFNEKACEQTIEFNLNRSPLTQANLTVLAECHDQTPWKLYITTTFNVFAEAVYASNSLPRGHTIQQTDVETKEVLINTNHYASFNQTRDVVGMIAKRSIRQGSLIHANLLQAPKLIKRGDEVVIMASTQGIMIRMRGTAMQDGELGEQITVKNNQSNRVIKAKVSQSGLVSVLL